MDCGKQKKKKNAAFHLIALRLESESDWNCGCEEGHWNASGEVVQDVGIIASSIGVD